MVVKARSVTIGTDRFKVRQGPQNFVRTSAAVMAPRTEISGQPGAESLNREFYSWTLTDFSGGEGRLVFDQSDPLGPPAYKQTDGGIDTRTRGEFSMQPLPSLGTGSGVITTIQGSAMTNVSGTVSSGTNRQWSETNDDAHSGNRTPGAVGVSVAFRMVAMNASAVEELRVTFRIRNETDGTNTDQTVAFEGPISAGTHTKVVSFTGIAAKTYRYHVIQLTNDGDFEIDYLTEETGGTVNDARALTHGYANNIWVCHWDGSNVDLYKWDFTNSEWDLDESNISASQIVALASSDKNLYLLYQDETIDRYPGIVAQHTGAGLANTTAAGLAVANNRLYYLAFGTARKLWEITLDGSAGAFAENTADYKRVMTEADFPDEETPDPNIRQRMTSIGNGVRFFVNLRGGPTTIYEFSEGAGRPLPMALPHGYKATAIHHYGGTTFIGVQFQTSATSPAQQRSAIYYIGADLVPRFLGHLRHHDPDDEPIYAITAYENDIYFLQGNNVWRYSGSNGGIVLDRTTPAADETSARGLAVMDRKMWIAYESQGVFVTQNAYPTDNTMYLYSPVWDFDVPDTNKTLTRIDVVTKPLPANTSISIDYQDNEDGTWTPITPPASASTTGSTNHTFPVWGTAAAPTTVNFRNLQWRVGLASTDGVSTPTVRSVTARAMVIDYQESFELVLDVTNDTSSNHLAGEQRSGRQKANNLLAYKTAKALVPFEDHYSSERPGDKDSYAAVLTDVTLDLDDKGEGVARVKLVTIS